MSFVDNTDSAWRRWGEIDPYFGVVSFPQFHRSELNEKSLKQFFLTGRRHG
jgi:hypothetical protein